MLCVLSTLFPPKKKSSFTIRKKNEMKKSLQIKLQKALKFCDHSKDDHLSEACEILWEEIDTLSDGIQQYEEE